MKSDTLLKLHAGTPLDKLPDDVIHRLETDSDLREKFEQQAQVAHMMSLKNYEVPDEAMFGRVHYRAHLQIQHQLHAPKQSRFTLWPTWARVTAVIMFMLGLSVLTHREMLRTENEETVVTAPPPEAIETLPPLLLEDADPFQPFTFDPARIGMDEVPSVLSRKLEADFKALGLTESTSLEPMNTLPVRFQAAPQP